MHLVLLLYIPVGYKADEMFNKDGLFIDKKLAFEIDNIKLRQIESAMFAKGNYISSGGIITV